VAGTSTGSIISGGIASGLNAQDVLDLYLKLSKVVFSKTPRSYLWILMRHRYLQRSPATGPMATWPLMKAADTTLLSLGTGRVASTIHLGQASRFLPWSGWIRSWTLSRRTPTTSRSTWATSFSSSWTSVASNSTSSPLRWASLRVPQGHRGRETVARIGYTAEYSHDRADTGRL
jgi:hypothetical protein